MRIIQEIFFRTDLYFLYDEKVQIINYKYIYQSLSSFKVKLENELIVF